MTISLTPRKGYYASVHFSIFPSEDDPTMKDEFSEDKEISCQTTQQSAKRNPNGKTINMNQKETSREELLPAGRFLEAG